MAPADLPARRLFVLLKGCDPFSSFLPPLMFSAQKDSPVNRAVWKYILTLFTVVNLSGS